MPKPACVPCNRFMRPFKNGVYVLENMPIKADAPPGNRAPEAWAPYKLWMADQWHCPDCGAQILTGWGERPIAEHYQKGFAVALAAIKINDC